MSAPIASPIWSTTAPLPAAAFPGAAPQASVADDEHHDALPTGTRLDEFEIVRVLGAGGFGIVYLALDHVLLRYVAIKEYMPTALAVRHTGATVLLRTASRAETFAMGLESFCNEARLLAGLDHPSLVKVYRFWKANGTAYMAMPYYPGHTLKEARRAMRVAPDEPWLRQFIEPLLGALELMHGQGVYHRDISPDNILLLTDGRPVLLDFGSARRVIGDRTQALTAILKPNFAPVEQYADEASMRQGPWTDLYGLGASLYFMLTGHAPTPAVLRAVRDSLPALSVASDATFPGVSTEFLAMLDWTLAVSPDDRPQSIAALRQALSGEVASPLPTPRHAPVVRSAPPAPTAPVIDVDPTAPAAAPAAFEPTRHVTAAAGVAVAPTPTPTPTPTAAAPRERARASKLATTGRALLLALAPRASKLATTGGALLLTLAPRASKLATTGGALFLALAGVIGMGAWAALSPDERRAVDSQAVVGAEAVSALARTASPLPAVELQIRPPVNAPATATPAATNPVAAGNVGLLSPPSAPTRNLRPSPAKTSAASAPPAAPDATPVLALAEAPPPAPVARRRSAQDALPVESRPSPVAGPTDACQSMNFVARAICVNRECQAGPGRSHPQCAETRRSEEQRQRRMDQ